MAVIAQVMGQAVTNNVPLVRYPKYSARHVPRIALSVAKFLTDNEYGTTTTPPQAYAKTGKHVLIGISPTLRFILAK
jgi:hypothetical protein